MRRMKGARSVLQERQTQTSLAASSLQAVLKRQRAAVRLGDLTREHEDDAGAARLRCEEGHEEVGRVRESESFVLDADFDVAVLRAPADAHRASRDERSVRSVAHQVDEKLFELVG